MRDITSHPAHRLVVASVPVPVPVPAPLPLAVAAAVDVAVAVAVAVRCNPVHGRGGSRWHPAGAERPGGDHLDAPAARRQARRFSGPSRPGDALGSEPIAAVFPSHSAVVPKPGGLRLAFERLRPCGGAAAVGRPALVLSRSRRPSLALVGRRRVQAMHSTATIAAANDQRPYGCTPAHRLPRTASPAAPPLRQQVAALRGMLAAAAPSLPGFPSLPGSRKLTAVRTSSTSEAPPLKPTTAPTRWRGPLPLVHGDVNR